MKGEPPSPQLAGEIVVSHPLSSGAEHKYLESWNRYGTVLALGATVGNLNFHMFRNPATSGIIAVFEHTTVRSAAAGSGFNFRMRKQTTDGSSVTSGLTRLDARIGSQGSGLILSTGINITVGTFDIFFTIANTNAGQDYPLIITDMQEVTLLPGDAFIIDNQSANASTLTNHMWRERALEDSEKF